MFTEFFATILGKLSAGLLFAAVLVAGYLYFDNVEKDKALADKNSKISEQGSTITTLQGTIDSNTVTIKALQKQTAVDDETRKDVNDQTQEVVTKDKSVSQVTKQKIEKIEEKYAAQPQTPDNLTKKDAEISRTRITALTSVFCNSNPTDASCVSAALAASAAASGSVGASQPQN